MAVERETTAVCRSCGNRFTYFQRTKARTLCDDCAARIAREKSRKYMAKYQKEHRDKINAYHRDYTARNRTVGLETARCRHCGKEFEYYRNGMVRYVCDDCKKKKIREKKVRVVYDKKAMQLLEERRKRAEESEKTFSEYIKRASELHMTYGKFVDALERGVVTF